MNLTISNLSWDFSDNELITKLLKKKKISFIEFSPDLLLNNNFKKINKLKIKKFWDSKSIKLYSMQSILYNIENAYLFGNSIQRKNFLEEIKKKISLSKYFGTKIIVFGSPKNRKTFNKKKFLLNKYSIQIFKKIANYSKKKNILFCLEANPKIYKSEYLNYTIEAIKLIKKINNSHLRINLDLSTMIANKENIEKIVGENINLIKHAQVSVPYLSDIFKFKKEIKKFIKILKKNNYKSAISIEMLKNKKTNIAEIEKRIDFVQNLIKN